MTFNAGLVLLEHGALSRDELFRVLRAVSVQIENVDMANRALWVAEDGSMRFEDIPPS